jgi:hypothetical protein
MKFTEKTGKDRDKDQQAPTSAQTIFAEKHFVER